MITINIATYGTERNESLNKVIDSLNNNTIKPDKINIYHNDKEDIDYADNAKFYFIQYTNGYYFTCDDDILYPKTYIKDMINAINKYKCIVTHHGRILTDTNISYYRGHKRFRCLSNNQYEGLIDVPGTGVTAFHTDYFKPINLYKSEDKRMSDIIFALEAIKEDKDIMLLKHNKGYFNDLSRFQTDNCYKSQLRNNRQIELANKIYEIRNS